jgi:hypothetical protein
MRRTIIAGVAGVLCLLLTSFAPGQPPSDSPKGDAKREGVPPPKPGDDSRDPTKPSAALRDALGTGKGIGNTTAPKLPLIALKGRVIARGKPPAVLVSVENGSPLLISKGSVLTGPGGLTLKVKELNKTEVTIEVMPLNETIVLH